MSRPETELTDGLRDIFGFRETFDIVLACAFEPEEKGNTKYELYEAIGEVIRKIGKKPYLPHREIDLQWPCEKIYTIPNKIVIPTSDLVLCYLGISSLAAGIMMGSAINHSIPIIYLFEKQEDFNSLKVREDTYDLGKDMIDIGIIDTREYGKKVEYGSLKVSNGNVRDLEDKLNEFYKQYKPSKNV